MALSGAQAKLLHEALVSAFSFQDFRQLMAYDLDEILEQVVGQGPLDQVVYDLIEWADRNDRVNDLVRAAVQNRPQNLQVKAVATQLLTPAAPPAAGAATYDGPRRSRLRAALLDQFPKRSELAILLDDTLSVNLDATVNNTNHTEATFELTKWLGVDIQGRLKPFLAEAMKRRPNATELKALYTELFS